MKLYLLPLLFFSMCSYFIIITSGEVLFISLVLYNIAWLWYGVGVLSFNADYKLNDVPKIIALSGPAMIVVILFMCIFKWLGLDK